MKTSVKNDPSLESSLFDRLFQIADKPFYDSKEEMEQLRADHPLQSEQIYDMWLVLRGIVIQEQEVSAGQVENGLKDLRAHIRRRRTTKRIGYGVAAACLAVLVTLGTFFLRTSDRGGDPMLRMISQNGPTGDSIEIAMGDFSTRIGADVSVVHKEGSAVVVNDTEEIDIPAQEHEYIRLSVPYGRRSFVELSDGSRIWINSGSELVYPMTFGAERREIAVSGEIYLEVSQNREWPFVVKANDMEVRVLGTSFNINAYKDNDFTKVVLVEGKVEVRAGSKRTLSPGDMLTLADGSARIEKTDTESHTAWRNGYLMMDGDRLEDVLKRLSRYYNVEFDCDRSHADTRFYGKFELPDNLEQALANLSLTQPLEFERNGNIINVKSK